MARSAPIPLEQAMTWVVVALALALVGWGFFKHGLSTEVHQRFWADIFGRTDGPMTFRFFLQPTMAAIAAVHDGLRDARSGHKAFFWTALWDPSQPAGRLREGLTATARIMLLGIAMDVLYQHQVFDRFYPAEAVMIAILLAVVPYFIVRWLVELVARRKLRHANTGDGP
ncbi:hypothetical protein [Hyphomicrobium sp.]|uniref:hypothetical protein n=1 Tax=Hyphomicrobium sp. TaxID=82 RepID=UPI0025BFF874|nr:hypothetical protein [Hyphomicrobium sp.]